jgi:hypothetical protein
MGVSYLSVDSNDFCGNKKRKRKRTISFPLSLASILGKSIPQRDPGKLALGPGMILWPQCFRVIHASKRYVDGTGQVRALIGQGGSAFATESAHHVRRRSIRSWLALNEREFVSIKPRPRNKRRAARTPASSAMAICDPVCFAVRSITDGATETTSLDRSHEHSRQTSLVSVSSSS